MIKTIPIISILLLTIFFGCKTEQNYYLPSKSTRVYTGLENFIKNYSEEYKKKKVILITNHSGVNYSLKSNIALLKEKQIEIMAILAPEHGAFGYQNEYDKKKYLDINIETPIIYNLHKLKDNEIKYLLTSSDFVIFDIQDMGMRCYTYVSNLKHIIDIMHNMKQKLLIFDRPNPIGFLGVDGPMLEKKYFSKDISSFPGTYIYNLTIGEAGYYYKNKYNKKVNLQVIKLKNYNRTMFYHETKLPWIPPSPNLPTYISAIIYTGVELLEATNLSLGRGTTKPFEYIGAPWIKDPKKLSADLNNLNFKNFKFRPIYFKPTFSKYKGEACAGVQIFYTGGKFSSTKFAYKMISYLFKNYKKANWKKYKNWYDIDSLAGTKKFRKAINRKKSYKEFYKSVSKNIRKFENDIKKYYLY